MAPIIAALVSSGLRLIANAALVKGKEFIEEKTGVNLDKEALSNEDKEKLLQFQLEHEEELLKLQLENNKLGLEETKAYLEDVQDARKVHASVLTSDTAPWYAKAIQPALAAFVVLATVVLFAFFVVASGNQYAVDTAGQLVRDAKGEPILIKGVNQEQRDIIIYILGVLSAAVTQILSYYFGSSQSSAKKSATIAQALENKSD